MGGPAIIYTLNFKKKKKRQNHLLLKTVKAKYARRHPVRPYYIGRRM